MKEDSWNDCLENNSAIKRSPDIAKAKSLLETAKGRVEFTLKKELDENNANYIFEDYYSSIIEVIHALANLQGYNISNHICLGYYIKDVLKREELFRIFDDCRFKRNSLTYYGKRMDFETAKYSIERSKVLFNELLKVLDKELIS